jgi:sigma-E factor negative regulatory protein RseA
MHGDELNPAARSAAPASGADGSARERDGEALSAWLDGELDALSSEALLPRLLQAGAERGRFEQWCLVGDALRSHEVAAGHAPQLCARICAALDDEPALLAPRALPARVQAHSATGRRIASGIAVAAAAAVVAFYALPQLRDAPAPGAVTASAQSAPGAVQAPGAAFTVANVPGASAAGKRDQRLDPYIQAHHDFSGNGVMPAAEVYLRFGNEGDR